MCNASASLIVFYTPIYTLYRVRPNIYLIVPVHPLLAFKHAYAVIDK